MLDMGEVPFSIIPWLGEVPSHRHLFNFVVTLLLAEFLFVAEASLPLFHFVGFFVTDLLREKATHPPAWRCAQL